MKKIKFLSLIGLIICIGVLNFTNTKAQGVWVTYNTLNSGLANDNIKSVTGDSNSNMWFGTEGEGASKYNGSIWTSYDTSNSDLVDNKVRTIAQDYSNNIWFGTPKGLSKYNGSTTWTTYDTSNCGIAGINIMSSAKDNPNNMWFGSVYPGTGVTKYDGSTWTAYLPNAGWGVISIMKDNNGNMWFGTYLGGVYKYDGANWDSLTTADGLASNNISSIAEDSNNNIWFGTMESGVSKYDGVNWTTYNDSLSGLVSDNVTSIAEDDFGNMWFGTDSGASKFDGINWTTYTISDGLVNNTIRAITKDNQNNIWFGTANGVSKLTPLNIAYTNISCYGADDGSITFTIDITPPVQYSIDGGSTFVNDSIFTSLSPGTYSTVVKNATDTINGGDIILTEPSPVIIDLGNNTTFCEGGSITLNPGSGYASYVWSNGFSGQSQIVDTSATISCKVKDSNGCWSNEDTINITVKPSPTVNLGNDTTFCEGGSVALNAGYGYDAYLWSNGWTEQIQTINTTIVLSVKVQGANGCWSEGDTVNIIVNPLPVADAGQDTTIQTGHDTILHAANAGSSCIYNWTPAGLLIDPNIQDPVTVILTSSETFTLTVTDTITGCQNTDQVNIFVAGGTLNVIVSADDTTLCYGETAYLHALPSGGSGNYSYQWSSIPAGFDDTILNPTDIPAIITTYTVTVDDGISTATDNVIITVSSLPVVDLGNDTTFCEGGSVNLDAGSGYDAYLWSNGFATQSQIISSSDTIFVTVKNANGCWSIPDTIIITVYSLHVVDLGNDTSICQGESVVLDAGAGYSEYLWSDGWTGQSQAISSSDTISVTVKNANGCWSIPDTIIVTVNSLPVFSMGNDTLFCAGSILDAGAGYSGYYWSDGWTGQSQPIFSSDTISVKVQDANGCWSIPDTIIVTTKPLPDVDLGPDTSVCEGNSVVLDPGAGFSSYLWSNGSTIQTQTIYSTDTISVSVQGANGCWSIPDTIIVTVNPLPLLNLNDTELCYGDILDAGAGYIGYLWSDGFTGQSQPIDSTDTISISVQDTNGCWSIPDTIIVTVNPLPTADAGQDSVIPFGTNITLNAAYAGDSCVYNWSPEALFVNPNIQNATTVNLIITTIFTLTVTDTITGCQNTDNVTVTISGGPLIVIASASDSAICAGESVDLSALASGGNGSYTYQWTSNPVGFDSIISNPTDIPTITTTYTIEIDDGDSTKTDSVIVIVNPLPAVDLGQDTTICYNQSVTLDATESGCTYLWSGGGSVDSVFTVVGSDVGVGTADYSVTVTNIYGCQDIDTITVTIAPNPVADAGPDISICYGECTVLTASGAGVGGSYFWNTTETTSSITVCPTTTSNYIVTTTNEYECTDVDYVVVTVNPLPVVDLGQDTAILISQSVLLDAMGVGYTYSWSDSSTNSTLTVNGSDISDSADYSVTVTNVYGCQSVDTITISIIDNIEDITDNVNINVFPNPSKGIFNISISGLNNNFDLTIFNIQGQIILKEKLNNVSAKYNKQLDVSDYPKGIYFLKFINKDIIQFKKIVIQ
jgi:ligand-binding sensor domain-containing protein